MLCAVIFSLSLPCAAWCGEADVERVAITPVGEGTFRFDVTVRHDDTGWDHYADKWEVLAPHGEILGTRTLLHPHENEQPFTRSLTGVAIPQTVSEVTVRAHDSVHEYGGKTATVKVPQ
jgi:hypothetical protein